MYQTNLNLSSFNSNQPTQINHPNPINNPTQQTQPNLAHINQTQTT